MLMLSPFWLHRNPKYFPEPELFKPERWKKANLEKHAFLDWFMAFGSGKYQCPGRSGDPGDRVLFGWLVVLCDIFVGMSTVASDEPHENKNIIIAAT
ncbi:hypothetical protein GH733_000413 [Mirounga leonina]|nr:hypothetical protein GH733_000413 [Mirounga leonina]